MKSQCESLLEQHENVIETWYFKHQDSVPSVPLIKYLCEDRALKGKDTKCLYESLEEAAERKGETDNEAEEKDEL